MPHVPPLAWQQIERYLAASRPPCDYAALHALSDPESLLVIGNYLQQQSGIEAAEFAVQRQRLDGAITDAGLGPRFEPVAAVSWRPDDEGGSLQATVREIETGLVVTAIFRLVGESLRVYGAYLDEGPVPELALVTARCLAELWHWEPHDRYPVWPITGLALAFHRLHGLPDVPIEVLPEARFTCQGRGDCCHVATWGIATNGNALRANLKMPWDALGVSGPGVAAEPFNDRSIASLATFRFDRDAQGDCLAKSGQSCNVHAVIGWQPINPCLQFPFVFTATPDGVCVTASYSCHTVAENAGQRFSEREAEIRQRLQPMQTRLLTIPARIPFVPGGPVITWAAYRIVETRLLELLADESLLLDERLVQGTRLMMALSQVAGSVDGDLTPERVTAAWSGALPALPESDRGEADALARSILLYTGPDDPILVLGGGRWDAWRTAQGKTLGAALDEAMLVRYLRTTPLRKIGVPFMGATYPWSLVLWIHRLWQRDSLYRARRDKRPADHDLQVGTVRRIEKLHLHSVVQGRLYAPDDEFAQRLIRPKTWASLLVS